MGTLATYFRRTDGMVASADRAPAMRAESDPFRLRALPGDEIYFYAKPIDNSRVIRQADPHASGQCWSMVSAAAILLLIGASIVTPNVASVLAGYKLEGLKAEHQSLLDKERELTAREAALVSPERLSAVAKEQQLTSPAASQIRHLDASSQDGHFAKAEAPRNGVLNHQ